MRQLRLRVLVIALVAGLLVPVTAFARVLGICNMAGRSAVCCCHADSRIRPSSDVPACERTPCCTTVITEAAKATATHAGHAGDVPPAALLARLPAANPSGLALASGAQSAERARGPPVSGPPIFLRDCRILS